MPEQHSAPEPTPKPRNLLKAIPKSAWLPAAAVAATLATALIFGTGNNPKNELDWLSRLAASGDDGAQLQLGLAYRDGRYGLSADPKTGLYWLKRSAAAGNAYAADQVGTAYALGQGTAVDRHVAEQWWLKAAHAGNTDAELRLAEQLMQEGHERQAQKWLHAAARPAPLMP